MKKFLMLAAVFAGMFILTGCSDSPKDVAEKWVTALIDGDVEEANKYSTSDAKVLNAMFVSAMEKDEDQKKEMEKALDAIDDAEEKIDGDTAKLVFKDGEGNIDLKKVDGEWKVNVEK